ncbi:hypothetical protein BN2476_2120014 [Paraburkholderia piptadeniae]|uniref:Uncharacterized protein n=2 Tax=Paraburkholderia TaxID=1822464 RepID=A0A7X1NIH9_9BURK|nr:MULTISPECIES: hypothetical protein [Paraburkholderia]MPW22622.1 hypothetical protein [Paraburkholderia franconis]SIT52180.1 hypothetical protein BN2476_2120014 [Paraburkholderia piptadeniae]
MKDDAKQIATLCVEVTASNLHRDFARTALVIMVNKVVDAFLLALSKLCFLSRRVAQHLATIARC